MRIGATVMLAAGILLASPAAAGTSWCGRSGLDAQPRCKTGCPCGATCISCARTCRIGTSTTAPTRPDPTPARPTAPAPQDARTLLGQTAPDSIAGAGTWSGSASNRFYFRTSCPIVKLLAIGDQVVLPDSAAAERAGFKRLLMPEC